MDVMADIQPAQNESIENWMRNYGMVGGVGVVQWQEEWVGFRGVIGQLLVWWK